MSKTTAPRRPNKVVRAFLAVARWGLITITWVITLGLFGWGLRYFAIIFIGDPAYGAVDEFEFVKALFNATLLFLGATLSGWIVYKLLLAHERREVTS